MSILKVRDKNGNVIDIPAIRGKSAYAYAKDGGYAGTEAEFAEMLAGDAIPTYITDEAERVANAVRSVRTARTLTFSAMTDIHVRDADTTEASHINSLISLQTAGKGLEEIRKRIPLDFVALLGDYSYMSSANYTAEQTMKDILYVRKTLGLTDTKEIWCVGNHDLCTGAGVDRVLTEDELYAYVGANSDGVKPYETIERCYGYMDFDNQKIRVIYLNTNDCRDGFEAIEVPKDYYYIEMISAKQMRWLADVALDFTDKADAPEWGVVFLSHQPIDYGWGWYKQTIKILEAYRSKSKLENLWVNDYILRDYNGEGQHKYVQHAETFDFTNVEHPAEIICNVHGHIHNCGSGKCSSDEDESSSSYVEPWLWRLCVPNMCYGRYNEKYDTEWGEVDAQGKQVKWEKKMGSAEETSFSVVSIDRKNQKIYAHSFGAGKKVREFSYDPSYVPSEPIPLLDMAYRTYVPISEPTYIESGDARDMDYSKCYAVKNDGRRGSYMSSKIENFTKIPETNGFSFKVNSGSGYAIEFPVNVVGGKTYSLSYTFEGGGGYVSLLKFNKDTTFVSITAIHDNTSSGAHTVTFTPEDGYLYSIAFEYRNPEATITVNNISLEEKG